MLAFFASLFLIGAQDPALLEPFEVQGFNTTITVEIDAPRDVVFEAATGDVTGGRGNATFVDGHVEAVHRDDSFAKAWPE